MSIGKSNCCERPTRKSENMGYDICTRCEYECKIAGYYSKDEILTMRLLDLYDLPEDGTKEDVYKYLESQRPPRETYGQALLRLKI